MHPYRFQYEIEQYVRNEVQLQKYGLVAIKGPITSIYLSYV